MRRVAVMVVAVLVAVSLALGVAGPASAHAAPPQAVTYRPPVDAPVVDGFRPPAERWSAGNRGLEYDTSAGEPVVAAADGVVAFAGQVGGALHVVVLHADGVRTTYAYLDAADVHRGDIVHQGERVGAAGDTLHFGARIGDVYVDPSLLFGDGPPEVHLVPDADRALGTEEQERAGLFGQLLNLGGRITSSAVDWAGQKFDDTLAELRGAVHYTNEANPFVHLARLAHAGVGWYRQRSDCTPADSPTPGLSDRHLAVLVGGLGSTSEAAAVDDVDTAALGYAEGDVSRFSYRGGSTDTSPYEPADTSVDIRQSARLLREYLQATQAANPGVPIDVIAHSQGGLVAREALTNEFDGLDPTLPQVSSLVTLATPHQGTDPATAAAMFGATALGETIERGVGVVAPWSPDDPSVQQMSEASSFIHAINRRPLPEGLHATSIGARGDLAVPSAHTAFPGAENVTVPVAGVVDDHGRLPGSPAAQREIALAVNGQAPTCESFVDAMTDAVVSDRISTLEDAVGIAAWAGGRRLDRFGPSPWAVWN